MVTFLKKVMVLEYPSFLRVVVSTANLIYKDYERKTNVLFSQLSFSSLIKICDFEIGNLVSRFSS